MNKDNTSQLSPSCDDDRAELPPVQGAKRDILKENGLGGLNGPPLTPEYKGTRVRAFDNADLDALRAEKAAQNSHPTASYYSHSEQRWIPFPEPRLPTEPTISASYIVDTLLADPVALLRLADALEDARFERSHSQRLNAQAAK